MELTTIEHEDISRALHVRANELRKSIVRLKNTMKSNLIKVHATCALIVKFEDELERINNLLQGKFNVWISN